MKFSRFTLIVLVLFGLVLTAMSIVPASAQDADPVTTVESNPFAIVTEEAAAPSIVCEEGATCNLNEAPDTPAEANESGDSIPTPVVVVGGILFGLVFLGLLYNIERIAKIVAPLMSPESAIAIVTAALPTIMDAVMNNVANRIPTEIDDHMFIEAARQRGLTVARDPISGDYHTTHQPAAQSVRPSAPYPPVGGTPLGSDPTGSAGTSGAGTGFPPVR